MTKPSGFTPAETLEASTSSDVIRSRVTRRMPRIVGAGVLLYGWLTVSLQNIGQIAFVQQAESEIAAQSGPGDEQGPAMDIPKVSRRPGQNVFKPKVHQT